MSAGKWVHLNIFPEALIQLNQETLNHPQLMERLANHPAAEWEIRVAEICHYCDVLVNGVYMPEEIEKLCGILVKKLVERRKDNRGLLIIGSM